MEDGLLVVTFIIGVLVGGIAIAAWQESQSRACARKHNVYSCEMQWIPVRG